jgi:hypothetical protein
MKDGAYLCADERTLTEGQQRCSALVHAALIAHDDGKKTLSVSNAGGVGGVELEWPPRHAEFVDDEGGGLAVVPTSIGKVTFRWPTSDDYKGILEELGNQIEQDEAPKPDAPDKARQKFLKSLC